MCLENKEFLNIRPINHKFWNFWEENQNERKFAFRRLPRVFTNTPAIERELEKET